MKKDVSSNGFGSVEPCTGARLRVRVRGRDFGLGNPACATGSCRRPPRRSFRVPPSSALKAPARKKPAKQASDKSKESSGTT